MAVNQPEVFALMVLYHKNYRDSLTYQSIGKAEGIHLIVCDNSTKEFHNSELAQDRRVTYLAMEGNQGLSKAYNRGIDSVRGQEGILCLFDDDTEVPAHYFDGVRTCAKIYPGAKIYLPVVFCHEKIISPLRLSSWCSAKRFRTEKEIKSQCYDDLSAINSGMAMDLSILRDYRYDERIFLDGIDHKFMKDMRERGVRYAMLDQILYQNLSSFEKPKKEAAIERFRSFVRDTKIVNQRKVARFLIWKRACRLTAQYKSFDFLRCVRNEK